MHSRIAGLACVSMMVAAAGPPEELRPPRTPDAAEVAREAMLQGATSDPTAVSWAPGRIDLFVRGADNALWHKWFAGGWSGWESLGGQLTSGPDAASMGVNHLDVFARGTDGAVWHRWWNGSTWAAWESLGGAIVGDPSAVSWGSGRIDLFARGTDNTLQHKWFAGGWSGWESLGGQLTSGPDAASMDVNHLDVFARGTDGAVWHRWWGGSWSSWESLGGAIVGDPAAVSWGSGRIDLFARGTDNTLQHMWFAGGWSGWESLGGGLTSGPDAASMDVNHLDVFARSGGDNAVWHRWWGGSWSAWESLGAPGLVTAVVATTTTATATPSTTSSTEPLIAPRTTPTVMSDGPAPTGVTATGTPTTATVRWTAVSGAVNYVVNRQPAGTTTWTAVTPSPITTTTVVNDRLPDHRVSYTYQVLAYQADGHFGVATVNYTPPAPTDPTRLTATVKAPSSVTLTWQAAPGVSGYLVSGPGVASGTQTAGTSYTVAGAPSGSNVYRVASVFTPGGLLTAAATWPSVTAPVPPKPAAHFLTIRNGPGSNGEAWAHADKARICWPSVSSMGYDDCVGPLSTSGPRSLGEMLEWAFVPQVSGQTPKLRQSARDSLLRAVYLESAVFGDTADLGVGRRVWCRWGREWFWQVCLASSHGPGPGPNLEYGDPRRVADAAALNNEFRGFTVIFGGDRRRGEGRLSFLLFSVAPTLNLSGVADPAERFVKMLRSAYVLTDPGPPIFASANLDTQGPKFPPHACLSCHGGRYGNGEVIGASLLPLDPSRLAFSTMSGATRAEQESKISAINTTVVSTEAAAMVKEYLAGLYGTGTPIVPARTDVVPLGWSTQANMWRTVIRPYCISCHMAQNGPLAFASWADVVSIRDLVQRTICTDATMPHAELPFRRFWGSGGTVSLPGFLSTALGFTSCP